MKKNWYAVLNDRDDNDWGTDVLIQAAIDSEMERADIKIDWGTGSFDWSEAVKMAKSRGCEMIAEIDGGYDEDGHETTDPICVAEYISGEDF